MISGGIEVNYFTQIRFISEVKYGDGPSEIFMATFWGGLEGTMKTNLDLKSLIQKQLFADVLQNKCSKKFRKINRKTPVPESLFK